MITFVRLPWNNSEYSQTPVMHASLIHCPPHCMGFLNASTSERFFSGNQNVQIKGVCVSITLLQNKPRVSSLLIRKQSFSWVGKSMSVWTLIWSIQVIYKKNRPLILLRFSICDQSSIKFHDLEQYNALNIWSYWLCNKYWASREIY